MKLLINFGNQYVDVPGELLEQLVKCAVYDTTSYYKPYIWSPGDSSKIEVLMVKEEELNTSVETIAIELIIEENNRLTRENEGLRNKVEAVKQPVRELIVGE